MRRGSGTVVSSTVTVSASPSQRIALGPTRSVEASRATLDCPRSVIAQRLPLAA